MHFCSIVIETYLDIIRYLYTLLQTEDLLKMVTGESMKRTARDAF